MIELSSANITDKFIMSQRFSRFIQCAAIIFLLGAVAIVYKYKFFARAETISAFSLSHYDQKISHWIKPTASDYDQPLVSSDQQQKRLAEFYRHYFSSTFDALSPWNPIYVQQIINQPASADLMTSEKNLLDRLSNRDKNPDEIGYGANFRAHSEQWIKTIEANMNLAQFRSPLFYHKENRAITIANVLARALPTDDPHFYNHKLAGQGYPFDNLQVSALWAGTPVYILGESADRIWSLVLTPDFIAWIKNSSIAPVSNLFVRQWQTAVKNGLAAIVQTATPINTIQQHIHLLIYVGTVFPIAKKNATTLTLIIPTKNVAGEASMDYADVSAKNAVRMPWQLTPHHMAQLMRTLQGRPYGWGNMNFYNDCSAELKNLYTPFGIWLPRHSAEQVKQGVLIDKSAASPQQRLDYLMKNGHKLTTIIYIGGHVLMYMGNYPNPQAPHTRMAMSYQNMWGLRPADNSRRAVIGQAALFPLLLRYPEDHHLISEVNKKYFQISYLDEMPTNLPRLLKIELRILMYPELAAESEN